MHHRWSVYGMGTILALGGGSTQAGSSDRTVQYSG
jgi:hypothetical protein